MNRPAQHEIKKWLHLDERGGDHWIKPIYSAINEAVKVKKIVPLPKCIEERGLYITTRLNMLPIILDRIKEESLQIYEQISTYMNDFDYIFTEEDNAYAININNEVKYQFLIDIDALLFELNSVNDQMRDFFADLHKHVGKHINKNEIGKRIEQILNDSNKDTKWFKELDSHRNFFIHKGSPYLAIDITQEEPEILIMKKNLKTFSDSKKYFKIKNLQHIISGFLEARLIIQKHLINLFMGK